MKDNRTSDKSIFCFRSSSSKKKRNKKRKIRGKKQPLAKNKEKNERENTNKEFFLPEGEFSFFEDVYEDFKNSWLIDCRIKFKNRKLFIFYKYLNDSDEKEEKISKFEGSFVGIGMKEKELKYNGILKYSYREHSGSMSSHLGGDVKPNITNSRIDINVLKVSEDQFLLSKIYEKVFKLRKKNIEKIN